jgi:hypothetical protein
LWQRSERSFHFWPDFSDLEAPEVGTGVRPRRQLGLLSVLLLAGVGFVVFTVGRLLLFVAQVSQ